MFETLNDAFSGDRDAFLAVAATYAAICGAISLTFIYRVSRWPSTEGVLEDAAVVQFGGTENSLSDTDYMAKVRYHYTVDGELYVGHRLSTWTIVASHNARGILRYELKGIERLEDDRVGVYYNPAKPSKAYLIAPGWRSALTTGLFCWGTAAALWTARG